VNTTRVARRSYVVPPYRAFWRASMAISRATGAEHSGHSELSSRERCSGAKHQSVSASHWSAAVRQLLSAMQSARQRRLRDVATQLRCAPRPTVGREPLRLWPEARAPASVAVADQRLLWLANSAHREFSSDWLLQLFGAAGAAAAWQPLRVRLRGSSEKQSQHLANPQLRLWARGRSRALRPSAAVIAVR
jgi:hypothetical protein